MYHYGDKSMTVDEALLILKTRLTSKDIASDIWTAIQTCIQHIENPSFQINDDDTITMTIQQYCDDNNTQFANGINVGKRALMKSNIAKNMYKKGVDETINCIINQINISNDINKSWLMQLQNELHSNVTKYQLEENKPDMT